MRYEARQKQSKSSSFTFSDSADSEAKKNHERLEKVKSAMADEGPASWSMERAQMEQPRRELVRVESRFDFRDKDELVSHLHNKLRNMLD